MIINNKFRPPPELIEAAPIKKTFEYYNTTGNLWESRYLSSPKISKYYHDQQNTFLTGPSSPYNTSLLESTQKSKEYTEKALTNKKQSQNLLKQRRLERLHVNFMQIQKISKQIKNTEDSLDIRYVKPAPDNIHLPVNTWGRLNSLPACKLRHIIPPKVLEKDLQGIQNILVKTAEIEKLKDWKESQNQSKRLKSRLANVNRHNYIKLLEQRSGIEKIRDNSLPEGTFGYLKAHRTRQRTVELSKPRTNTNFGTFDHEDFRGLLHADFGGVINRVKTINSGKARGSKLNDNTELLKVDAQDIEEFENKINKSSKQSSLVVTSLDILKDFF
jgi:hypothetical protein